MAWILLVLAGLFEVAWAIGLKYSEGFTRFWPSAVTVVAAIVSLGLLGLAMKSLAVGTAYAVWVGVGAIGTAALGILLFGEPANAGRLLSLALILAGLIGLKLSSP
ncbi:MAG: quaternary ammonium compound efflux SMR transporter SugE [Gammaproteobacteria bacterium]|nr:quaternary ammonium compound efflux SMR transporter SugE [Gammaproteobacteria bacterium]